MNMKFKMDRQVVVAICVLLTAMLLPLTTFARDLTNTGEPTQGVNPRSENCAHCQSMHHSTDVRDCQHSHDALAFLPGSVNGAAEQGVGFAETDPANRGAPDFLTISQPAGVRMQQAFVGFAETDPADQRSEYGPSISNTSADHMQLAFVGFAETDPANNPLRPGVAIQSHHHVVCPHEICPLDYVKGVVYGAPDFPGLSGGRYCHDRG